ncbi:hypothetical protein VFMJ11_B0149 (plasmid) [Aliivibrio fischeri MJ11]|uniref:Uncharacterized protein n=1 Tax=Aliivibrio fischeri (strain MJ11) TaxID=388396 RepID=B5EW92_ALIFM|nr:hypothetical protein VFMJ11_B0149 [Aliivibrio fischeri MJ11]
MSFCLFYSFLFYHLFLTFASFSVNLLLFSIIKENFSEK